MKLNCWEHMKCGREPGGIKEDELGRCPACSETKMNGIHGGKNAGRTCWVVAGTFCRGKVAGTYAEKQSTCLMCEFFMKIRAEEGDNLIRSMDLEEMLNKPA